MPLTSAHLPRLVTAIRAAGVAIDGVDINGRVTPTTLQAAAQATINAFDTSQSAQDVWLDGLFPDLAALRDQATQAIADINTYVAIASPTNAQAIAEVRAIDVRQRAIIKALKILAMSAIRT